jgi:hypothetical protein
MMFSIDRPRYVNTGGRGHTLSEIAVQAGPNNGNIVELGWTVSTDDYGDADPHIFVFHWIAGEKTCYDSCGWVQVSNTHYPGENVAALIGRDIYVGYIFRDGSWWAWFDDEWLGYFPASLWKTVFSTSELVQWFGEVATFNGVPPQSQMGRGILPAQPTAAHMHELCDVDVAAWACRVRNEQQLSKPAAPKFYGVLQAGYGDVRYGGPGK